MSSAALVIGIVVAIFVVIAIALIVKSLRSQRLKSRFGPEYVQETGSKKQAEAKLEKLAKRVQSFKISDLPPTARADFVSAWQKIQGRFVDDPKDALTEAGEPVLITKRGAPVAKIVPVSSKKRSLFGFMAGQFEIVGNIESPVVPLEAWEVMRK